MKPGGRPRCISAARSSTLCSPCCGCALPHDHPPWQTVYVYFRMWRDDGTWEQVNTVLRERLRITLGRDPQPSAAIIDCQRVMTTENGGRGDDGGKKLSGRKRPLLVDTKGLLLRGVVHAADLSDRNAVHLPLAGVVQFPRMRHLWVDAEYTGWTTETLGWSVEVVKHPPRRV